MSKLCLIVLLLISTSALAEQECKVSMMGRVCYNSGNELETSSHMKSNSVKMVAQDTQALNLNDKNKDKDVKLAKQNND